MADLGKRCDFHSHTVLSDGALLPAALLREAEVRGHKALAITDHVDPSNMEEVIKALVRVEKELKGSIPVIFIPGVEVSYLPPQLIEKSCRKARKLGAKIIVVHGESPVEPVKEGTNRAAVSLKGVVDILAHPGNISDEEVKLAAKNGVFLELSARKGHREGNRHVAELAIKYGAMMLVNTDSHSENDLITQERAYEIAKEAGLPEDIALRTIADNPKELLKRTGYQ